jgi:hypothetical protein
VYIAYIVVTVLAIVANGFIAVADFLRAGFVVDNAPGSSSTTRPAWACRSRG